MEARTTLSPNAPLFTPSSFHHPPPYIATQRFLFPAPVIIVPNFRLPPPPPTFPAPNPPQLRPRLYHQLYYSLPHPLLFSNPVAASLLLPSPPDFQSHFYEQQQQPPAPPQAERAHSRSILEARTPVSAGPRIQVEGDGNSRWKKKVQRPEKKERNNNSNGNSSSRAPKIVGKNVKYERKLVIGNKFVKVEKSSDKEEIMPLRKDEPKTTIMIKNIPNCYKREMLIQLLDEHCKKENERAKELISAYDFVYLPIDFFTRHNKGYAFVNFTNPKAVWKFYEAFNETSWESFGTQKIINVVSAKLQGKEALVAHFQQSTFFCHTDEYLPLHLDPPRDGSGVQVIQRPVGEWISPRRRSPYIARYG